MLSVQWFHSSHNEPWPFRTLQNYSYNVAYAHIQGFQGVCCDRHQFSAIDIFIVWSTYSMVHGTCCDGVDCYWVHRPWHSFWQKMWTMPWPKPVFFHDKFHTFCWEVVPITVIWNNTTDIFFDSPCLTQLTRTRTTTHYSLAKPTHPPLLDQHWHTNSSTQSSTASTAWSIERLGKPMSNAIDLWKEWRMGTGRGLFTKRHK